MLASLRGSRVCWCSGCAGDVGGADAVAVGDGGQALDVGAEQPRERPRLGLAQLRELRGDVGDRAVVLAELPAGARSGAPRQRSRRRSERLGQGVAPGAPGRPRGPRRRAAPRAARPAARRSRRPPRSPPVSATNRSAAAARSSYACSKAARPASVSGNSRGGRPRPRCRPPSGRCSRRWPARRRPARRGGGGRRPG